MSEIIHGGWHVRKIREFAKSEIFGKWACGMPNHFCIGCFYQCR